MEGKGLVRYFLLGALLFGIGLVLYFYPNLVLNGFMNILGIFLVVAGVFGIYIHIKDKDSPKDEFFAACLDGIFGLILLFSGFAKVLTMSALPILIAIYAIIRGGLGFFIAFKTRGENPFFKAYVVVAVAFIIFGVFLLFNPVSTLEALIKFIGMFLTFFGLIRMILTFFMKPKDIIQEG